MAYIYALHAKNSTSYFYVGSTKNTLEHRLKQHLDCIRLGYNNNKHLVSKVKQVGLSNVAITLLEECPEGERFKREYKIMGEFIAKGVRLTNVVISAEVYEQKRAEDEYSERIYSPGYLKEAYLHIIQGCGTAKDESDQALLESFYAVAVVYFAELENRLGDRFKDLLENKIYINDNDEIEAVV